MKAFRDIRVLPVVLVAVAGLAVLKLAGLFIDGGYVFDYRTAPAAPRSWAQETFNFPSGRGQIDPSDITGSVPDKKEADPVNPEGHGAAASHGDAAAKLAPSPPASGGTVVFPEQAGQSMSASERAVLERLQARRQELDARAREIDIRENLLKAAEARMEAHVDELKGIEARITAAKRQKDEAEVARFKGIVTMYEAMKPKDAARVFDRLDMPVLIEIASQIAPRKMSDVLGLMAPEAAERLTVELARRAGADKSASAAAELPKIEGKVLPQNRN